MAKRRGFPKPNASTRTISRWKMRARIKGNHGKVKAWEAVNGEVQF